MALKVSFVCPHCGAKITGLLSMWEYSEAKEEDNPLLLIPRLCESCGLYGCYIKCPKYMAEINVFD